MRGLLSKKLTLLLLVGYIYLAIFSLFTMSGHDHMPMADCPYMQGQHSLCAMDSFAHLSAWKAKLLTLPNTIYLFATLILIFVAMGTFLSSSPPLLRQLLYYKKTKSVPIVSKLEQQFSRGILNPKPY